MKYRLGSQFLFLFSVVLSGHLHSQGKIITDNPFYTTFDNIHYAVLIEKPAEVYFAVELVDHHGKSWAQQKLKIKNRILSGKIALNYRIPTGFYWLRVYPAAFYKQSGFVLYQPLVIVNSDNLDQDQWKNALLKKSGKPAVYIFNDNSGQTGKIASIKIGVIDETGKIISGKAELTDTQVNDFRAILSDNDGLFRFSIDANANKALGLKVTTAEKDSFSLSFNPSGTQTGEFSSMNSLTTVNALNPFQIIPDKNNYSPEDSVHIHLSQINAPSILPDSGISISVSEKIFSDVGFNKKPVLLISHKQLDSDSGDKNNDFRDGGFYLRGNYMNPASGKPRANYSIALLGLGSKPWISFTHADKNGDFIFDVSAWPENNSVYISTIGQPAEGLAYSDQYFRNFSETPAVYFGKEDFAPLDTFINESKIRKVLYFQYLQVTHTAAKTAEQILYDTTRIYPKPDVSYDLNEYIQFDDMADVIHNILIYVHLTRTKRGDRMIIFNNQNPSLNKNPLYLINGIPTRDLQLVLGLNIKDVQKIDLLYNVNSIKPFGIAGLGGIMAIYTKQNVDIPNTVKVNLKGLYRQEGSYVPERENGIPDFSPVIFWDPDTRIDLNSRNVNFRLNNLISDMKISAVGFDSDGKIVQGTSIINVKTAE